MLKSKWIAVTCLSTFVTTQALAGLQDGAYKGKALWQTKTGKGEYEVRTVIQGKSVRSEYTLPDGTKKEWNFDMVDEANGFFKVKVNSDTVGSGYCLERAQVCHYEVNVDHKSNQITLEETLTTMNGKLYRFGSKKEGSGSVMWQEEMGYE